MEFRDFLLESDDADIVGTVKKLPKRYQKLLAGYKFNFQDGHTLHKDNQHVGVIDEKKKSITIAAPWFHSKEFTLLHEIGHLVWKYLVDKDLRQEWSEIAKDSKIKENDEELFCHSFANHFCKHKNLSFYNKEWDKFINRLNNGAKKDNK